MKPSLAALLVALGLAAPALAEDASCKTIRMSDPGWSDITSTNALAGVVLDALGYARRSSRSPSRSATRR